MIERPAPESVHDHPIAGPVVTVHSRDEGMLGQEHPAHAWGPFATEDEARAWEALQVDDTCHVTILDVFDPYEFKG